jgi:hypothetical protein
MDNLRSTLRTEPPAITINPGTPDPTRTSKVTPNIGHAPHPKSSEAPELTPESVAAFFDDEFIRKMTIF